MRKALLTIATVALAGCGDESEIQINTSTEPHQPCIERVWETHNGRDCYRYQPCPWDRIDGRACVHVNGSISICLAEAKPSNCP